MYIKRHLEKMLIKAESMFGAVLVSGSRQVGKTTLLRNAKADLPYVTLDDPIMLASAVSEPGTFFKATPPPLVVDEVKFLKFMTAAAAMTGQLLNQASLARDAGISQPTAERWLSVLRASNLVYLLQPYHNNIIKRAIKTPKLYVMDTGLAAYLTRWNTPEVLQHGAMAGAFFETFVVAEILKSYANAGVLAPSLYFYRDKEQERD